MAIYQNPFAKFYKLFGSLLNEECAGNDGEQSTTLDKSRCKNHVGLNLARSLRLACDGIHCAAAYLTNTQTCANYSDASSKTAAQLSQTHSSQK